MAWEWVSPVAGAVVALAGLSGGWLNTRASRRHDEQMGVNRAKQEYLDAHERWYRDKRAEAYLDLLRMAEATGQWVEFVHPVWTKANRPVLDLPQVETQGSVRAAVIAYGSPSVRRQLGTWLDAVQGAVRAAEDVADNEEGARRRFEDARRREAEARDALGNQISRELLGPFADPN